MFIVNVVTRFLYYRPLVWRVSTSVLYKRHLSIFSGNHDRNTGLSYYITTPIFYVNTGPHIGHLHSAVLADVAARWQMLKGRSVVFSTGTDEHGLKIQQAAASRNKEPMEHCDEVSALFQNLFDEANIQYSRYIRTTETQHTESVQHFWHVLEDAGHIYKGRYSGWYCTSDEAFLSEDQVTEIPDPAGQAVKVSVDSQQPVEWMEEENYIFRLSHFKEELLSWLNGSVIRPAKFEEPVYRWITEGLQDLSVSRPRDRLHWGIPVPGDPTQTVYVWMDALVNYLTVGGYPRDLLWPAQCQVIGKDILKFHAVYWPALLMAAGLSPPTLLHCHSHWLIDGFKMSKSRGNVVDPLHAMKHYGCDGLRFFLMRESVSHADGNYNEQRMVDVLNSELANTYGNLLNRCTGTKLNPPQLFPTFDIDLFRSTASPEDEAMWLHLQDLPGVVDEYYCDLNINKAIGAVMSQLRDTNRFFEQQQPWKHIAHHDNNAQLNNILYIGMETLRTVSILLGPVVPLLASRILDRLNIDMSQRSYSDTMDRYSGGSSLSTDTGPVFPRITK